MKYLLTFLSTFVLIQPVFTQEDPLNLAGTVVEANEWVIFHTNGTGNSNTGTKTTIGRYDPAGANASQKIVETTSVSNPSNANTTHSQFAGAMALDYDADGLDEMVVLNQYNLGAIGLLVATIDSSTLTPSIASNEVVTALPTGSQTPSASDLPLVKMAKGVFDDTFKERLVLLHRSSIISGGLMLEMRTITGPSSVSSNIQDFQYTGLPAYPSLSSNYEAFDVAVGDYDNDGKQDIAVAAFEEVGGTRQCYVQFFEIIPPDFVNFFAFQAIPRGKVIVKATGASSGWENLGIATTPSVGGIVDRLSVALAYRDPNNNNTIKREVFPIITDDVPGVYDLNTPVMIATPYSSDLNNGGTPIALSVASFDLNNDRSNNGETEFIVAWDGEVNIFHLYAQSVVLRSTGGVGTVQDEFYKLSYGNAYLSAGDVDYDSKGEILVVTTDDDGNSGNETQTIRVTMIEMDSITWGLTNTGQREIQPQSWAGASYSYRLAATLGEFFEGRGTLGEPVKSTKVVTQTMIVNNGPPHHFDIINNQEMDITEVWPTWPTTAAAGTMEATYIETSTETHTLEATLSSDWAVSGTVTGGTKVLGVGLEARASATYGEAFSNTQTNDTTIRIETAATARADDQLFAVVQDYDFYEYPVIAAGKKIGYFMAMLRTGTPIVKWTLSKLPDAIGYAPGHEPGNILSYASLADFDDYNGVIERVHTGTGYEFGAGAGNPVQFSVTYSTFTNNTASTTKSFSASVGASAGYRGVTVDVEGNYSQETLKTHSSSVSNDVTYFYDLDRALDPAFADASYTITPIVYWGENGALNLDYAVDPSLSGQGGNTFWSDKYGAWPDFTLILPWKYDVEKGLSLGSTADKVRQCKSIFLDKSQVSPGDTVMITAYIQNYSFVGYNGSVDFQFYEGNPDNGGTLLSDINGNSTLTVNTLFGARQRIPIQFPWKVQSGGNAKPIIYIVIDPQNQVTEIHEDNNVGWITLGNAATVSIEDDLEGNTSFSSRLFPNPTTEDQAQVEFNLPRSGEVTVELRDMQGRLLKTAYKHLLAPGNYILPVNISSLPNGTYLVRIQQHHHQEVLKLVRF